MSDSAQSDELSEVWDAIRKIHEVQREMASIIGALVAKRAEPSPSRSRPVWTLEEELRVKAEQLQYEMEMSTDGYIRPLPVDAILKLMNTN